MNENEKLLKLKKICEDIIKNAEQTINELNKDHVTNWVDDVYNNREKDHNSSIIFTANIIIDEIDKLIQTN